MDFEFPVKADKTYTIKQTNPALGEFYPSEFSSNIKEKDYAGQLLLDEPYQIVLMEEGTPVEITVKEKDTGTLISTVNITNAVTFA